MKRIFLLVVSLWVAGPAPAARNDGTATLVTHPVPLAGNLHNGDVIGHIRVRGMLELQDITVGTVRLSQLSGLAWDDDDGVLYAVSDKGGLFQLQPLFENDMLVGLKLLKAVPLRELRSDKPLRGKRADSEGLDVLNGRNGRRGDAELLISFERFPRVVRYRPDGRALGEYPLPVPLNDPKAYHDPNQMLEAVCRDPHLGILTVPEAPLRGEREGMTRIFSLSGESWLYPLASDNRISGMECLGHNEVLVLEREFGFLFGRNVIGLKRARLPDRPSATDTVRVETIVTLDAAKGLAIDNFEGLARHKGDRFFMVSDDNDLFVQRTLLLYFELIPN